MPAILKGWFDRVLTNGFAHGPAVPPPYTKGALGGRRALVHRNGAPPPFATYDTIDMPPERFTAATHEYARRLD